MSKQKFNDREVVNVCILAVVIGCVNPKFGRKVVRRLGGLVAEGQNQFLRLATSFAHGAPALRQQRAEDALSQWTLSLLTRSRIGGFDPESGHSAKAYFCQSLRNSLYHTVRCEKQNRRRPLEEAEKAKGADDERLLVELKPDQYEDVFALAKRILHTLPDDKRAIILTIFPFLGEEENGVPAPLDPDPPVLPGYAKSRAIQAFLREIQTVLDLPHIMPSEAKHRAKKRLDLVKRRRKPKAAATDRALESILSDSTGESDVKRTDPACPAQGHSRLGTATHVF